MSCEHFRIEPDAFGMLLDNLGHTLAREPRSLRVAALIGDYEWHIEGA